MDDVHTLPVYRYPWHDLERAMTERTVADVPVVAYGSLLNRHSARRTLPRSVLDEAKPVVAAGVQRVFDYRMSEAKSVYGAPLYAKASAALNVHVVGNPKSIVNGLLIRLTCEALAAFRDREEDYDLVPVACVDWEHPRESFPAYILQSEVRADSTLLPHRAYYLVCRRGASAYGEAFLRFWLQTTYLGDRTTLVADWEQEAFPDGIPAQV